MTHEPQVALREKWSSSRDTGINAKKGSDALVLRELCGGGQYAIIKLIGGCWMDSPMEVIEEIDTTSEVVATDRFNEVAAGLDYETQPIRGFEQFFVR